MGCCITDDVQYNATDRIFTGLFRTIQLVFDTIIFVEILCFI